MREYPTDEELKLWIEDLEQQELYAPRHMKEQILNQAFPKQAVELPSKAGSAQKPVTFLSYRLKMIAGMAAALIMLAVIPMQSVAYGPEKTEKAWEEEWKTRQQALPEEERLNLNVLFNEGMRKVNKKMNTLFEKENAWQILNLTKRHDGGNQNEN